MFYFYYVTLILHPEWNKSSVIPILIFIFMYVLPLLEIQIQILIQGNTEWCFILWRWRSFLFVVFRLISHCAIGECQFFFNIHARRCINFLISVATHLPDYMMTAWFKRSQANDNNNRLGHGSGSRSPDSHRLGPHSIPCQSTWKPVEINGNIISFLLFYRVSIIRPMPHTHMFFAYHRRYISMARQP